MNDFEEKIAASLRRIPLMDRTIFDPWEIMRLERVRKRRFVGLTVIVSSIAVAGMAAWIVAVVISRPAAGGRVPASSGNPAADGRVSASSGKPALVGTAWTFVSARDEINGATELPSKPVEFVWRADGTMTAGTCRASAYSITGQQINFLEPFYVATNSGCIDLPAVTANFVYGSLLAGEVSWVIDGDSLTLSRANVGEMTLDRA